MRSSSGISSFQSTRPVWGATFLPRPIGDLPEISIHAPRVGRDSVLTAENCLKRNFNPRAPCGARPFAEIKAAYDAGFQSTRPVWGATHWHDLYHKGLSDFNPRAPCGARQQN